MSNSIVPGSLSAIAEASGKSIAETFLSAEVIIIVDTSGSMSTPDSRDHKTRYNVACEELKDLQRTLPGKIAVINFSDDVRFEPAGIPYEQGGGTDLLAALKFVKIADLPGMKFILISDGQPESPDQCILFARAFKNHIDVIYVGPEHLPSGRDFLTKLASVTGGQTVTADRAKELKASVMGLLGAGQ